MIDPALVRFASRTVHVNGIELPYREGTAFISFELLEELTEADNSWGMGGAFLISDKHAQAALDQAGLLHVETKGGVYTDDDQREVLRALIKAFYEGAT